MRTQLTPGDGVPVSRNTSGNWRRLNHLHKPIIHLRCHNRDAIHLALQHSATQIFIRSGS